MRRLPIALVLLAALTSTAATAQAASWHTFSSKSLGFSLRYPATWKVSPMSQMGEKQIQFSYAGTPAYNVSVTLIALKSGTSLATLKKRFLDYQRRIGNTTMASIRWATASLGGKPGMGGVYVPATEGGTSIANGIYVIPRRATVYVVNITAMQSPAPTRLDRFPAVYRQILATWRFT